MSQVYAQSILREFPDTRRKHQKSRKRQHHSMPFKGEEEQGHHAQDDARDNKQQGGNLRKTVTAEQVSEYRIAGAYDHGMQNQGGS